MIAGGFYYRSVGVLYPRLRNLTGNLYEHKNVVGTSHCWYLNKETVLSHLIYKKLQSSASGSGLFVIFEQRGRTLLVWS